MFKWLGSVFSSEKMIDNVSSGVDKAFYTDQEKREGWERLARLYEPFKIAQRYIAFGLFFMISIMMILAVVVRLSGFWFEPTPQELKLISEGSYIPFYIATSEWIVLQVYKLFFEPFLWAVVFYYGGGATEGLVEKWKNRNSNFVQSKRTASGSSD